MSPDNSNTHGLWAATAPPPPDCPPLIGREECDVAIIGAGYTGVSAALFLAEGNLAVRVLDTREPGWGCSGRNGGQINPGWKLDLDEISKHYGTDWQDRVTGVARSACDHIFDLIDRHFDRSHLRGVQKTVPLHSWQRGLLATPGRTGLFAAPCMLWLARTSGGDDARLRNDDRGTGAYIGTNRREFFDCLLQLN